MNDYAKIWTWAGSFAAGLSVLMWLTAIGAKNVTGLPIPFIPAGFTESHQANAIISLTLVALLIHLIAWTWRRHQALTRGRRWQTSIPKFAFKGLDIDPGPRSDLGTPWALLSVFICAVLPFLGTVWFMQYIADASVYGIDHSKLPDKAFALMKHLEWGGENQYRIGNPSGGEFFPVLTILVFLLAVAGWVHLLIPGIRMARWGRGRAAQT